jgi:predicted nucleic acid-binding protein
MATNHCIVDSSVFVAFYRDVDSQHSDALAVMKDLQDATLIVHPYVIQETATVLTYRVGLSIAKQFCADVLAANNVLIPAVDARYDSARFLDLYKRISFTDAALIELSRTTGARIVTFDAQMRAFTR